MTLDFTILRELSEIEAIASEWDALVAETGADIYFHRTWIETWWEVFGAGRRPLIACIRLPPSEGGRLVGLLVFVTEEFRLAGPGSEWLVSPGPIQTMPCSGCP